jgi:hypothetical protein
MIKILSLSLTSFLLLASFACQTATETNTVNQPNSNTSVQPLKPEPVAANPVQTIAIDVPKLADKSIAEIDRAFGKPEESRSIENKGEYRLYKVAGESRGLAVRFYKGRAKSFNLISDKTFPTSKEALKQIFNIDVGNTAAIKDPKETLSEKYQGTFGGVKFTKVSAKRQENGNGFIFVLAEVAE